MGSKLGASRSARALAGVALALAVLTVAGLFLLWPDGSADEQLDQSLRPPTEQARVRAVEEAPCQNPAEDTCRQLTLELLSGPDEGEAVELPTGGTGSDPDVDVGDRVRVGRNEVPEGQGGPDVHSIS